MGAGLIPHTLRVTSPTTGRRYLDEVLDPPGSVLAFAHRGGVYHPEIEGLENTLQAFRHAYALGYRYLETDVHVTADGVLLAFHDAALDRVTDQQGVIAGLTHAEIRRARIGGREEVRPSPPWSRSCPASGSTSTSRPTAPSDRWPTSWPRGASRTTSWSGRSRDRAVREFRRLSGGRVATSAAPAEVAAFLAVPRRAAPFDALQIPHRRGPLVVASARLVRRAHAAGKHVHVWTVDAPEEMRELLDRGVDGLFTDRTDVLKDVLVERGQWRDRGMSTG